MANQDPKNPVLAFVKKKLSKDYWVFTIKRRPWLKYIFLALLGIFIISGAGGYYYVYRYIGDLKDDQGQPLNFDKLAHSDFKRASYVYTSDGEIAGRYFDEIRDPVKIGEVPDLLKKGFIAAEDSRFYKRGGFDIWAIGRAGVWNGIYKLLHVRYQNSGASTIDQQFVRLWYSDEIASFKNREHSYWRKFKEIRVATQIDKKYPKDKILEGFLNMIYFGHGVNGVAEASRRYFNKDIRRDQLTLREIAILVSLNKSPTLYCPVFHKPEKPIDEKDKETEQNYEAKLAQEMARIVRARDRYNWVLERMYEQRYIDRNSYQKELFKKDEPPELAFMHFQPLKNSDFGYGNRFVKEMLLNSGHDDSVLSYSGGLRIYTSFDSKIQKIATKEFEKHLTLINKEKEPDDQIEGAFVIIEVKTGKILALSGGHDFNETQYNRVLASRSPGSGFKPFTYAAAIEYFHKDFFDRICNCPFSMRGSAPGKIWSPKNFKEDNPVPIGGIYLATGLIRSVNLATLNLARTMNIKSIVELANNMGVWGNPGVVRDSDGKVWFKKPNTEIQGGLVPLLPTAIGASDVNLIELANAYAVLFRGGIYLPPTLISEIKDTDGTTIYKNGFTPEKRVLSEETSDKVLALMRAITKVGTAKISMRGIEQQVAVKTGTSNGPNDLMMIGGTPEIILAIRVGHDSPRPIAVPEYMKKVSGASNLQVSAGWVVGPMYRKIIDEIYKSRPKVAFDLKIEKELQELLARLSSNGT